MESKMRMGADGPSNINHTSDLVGRTKQAFLKSMAFESKGRAVQRRGGLR